VKNQMGFFKRDLERNPKKAALPRIRLGFTTGVIISAATALVLYINAESQQPKEASLPFKVGEKLKYKGTWNFIPAGEITLEVLPKQTINGVLCHHFVMTTKTSQAVDLIYKIRERQDSYVDAAGMRSVLYIKKTESKHPRDEVVRFDRDKMEMIYTNFGETRPPKPILPGTLDPLGFLYMMRLHPLKEDSEIYLPVTDGNNVSIEVRATIGKKSELVIGGRRYSVVEITPNLEVLDQLEHQQLLKKTDDPKFRWWMTDDDRKVPVRLRTRVSIMTFDFDLVLDEPDEPKGGTL